LSSNNFFQKRKLDSPTFMHIYTNFFLNVLLIFRFARYGGSHTVDYLVSFVRLLYWGKTRTSYTTNS
jgi:hypothetical protein